MLATRPVTRVLLFDDQLLVRQGIALQIRAEPLLAVAAGVDRCDEALSLLKTAPPDVVLIGADLRESDAFVSLGKLRAHWPGLRSVLLTTIVRDAIISRAITFAVDAIVTRHDPFSSIRSAIHAVAGGRRMYSRQVWSHVARNGGALSSECAGGCKPPKLTRRESEVLRHLASGRTVKGTACALGLAAATVDNHKTRLMKKLNVHSGIELTRYAIREGLVSA